MRKLPAVVVVLLASLVLGSPSVSAADPRPPEVSRQGGELFLSVWSFLASLWEAVSSDAGCIIDPLGGCREAAGDAGACIDPLGGCREADAVDEGPRIDPLGGSVAGQ